MSGWNSRPVGRWLVPAAVALAVIGGGAAIGALGAVAEPRLAPRSAAQLLVDVQTARLDGLSGTVVQRADLGLPGLLGLAGGGTGGNGGGQGSTDLTSLISGTHTLRIWYAGPDQARVALLGTLGETDVILNGRDLWTWDSRANKATHRKLPANGRTDKPGAGLVPLDPGGVTPQQLADAALAAISPTTDVSTSSNTRVAGRDAYELSLAPRDRASLVAAVRVAIDAQEHIPLRVQVFAKGGGDPAIEVAFTEVSFARPDPEQFAFNPPPGATVTEEGDDHPGTGGEAKPGDKPGTQQPGTQQPKAPEPGTKLDPTGDRPAIGVVGESWTSVLVARLPKEIADSLGQAGGAPGEQGRGDPLALLGQLPKVSGPWGTGRLLTSKLFSALLTDDGRVLVGAVTPERLYLAAMDPAAQLPR